MLAKAATASAPPTSFKFSRNFHSTPFPFINLNGLLHRRSSIKWTTRAKVSVRAGGYTKRPLDTAGAYELIDDETGEKVIVWGGIDDMDNDSLIPSKDVLTWKPSKKSNGEGKGGSGFCYSPYLLILIRLVLYKCLTQGLIRYFTGENFSNDTIT